MAQQDLLNQIVNRVNDFNRRVRDLEEKIRNLTARVNTLDDSLLNKTNNLNEDIQDLREEVSEARDRIANIEVDIKEINREKRKYVTSQELEEVENYMDLMNPIKSSFVTKKEAKRIVEESQGLTREQVERIVEKKMKEDKTGSLGEKP